MVSPGSDFIHSGRTQPSLNRLIGGKVPRSLAYASADRRSCRLGAIAEALKHAARVMAPATAIRRDLIGARPSLDMPCHGTSWRHCRDIGTADPEVHQRNGERFVSHQSPGSRLALGTMPAPRE